MKPIMVPCLAWAGASLLLYAAPAPLPNPDPARLKADLEFLCSADLTGRETGTEGCAKAAAYVADRMREWHLTPIKAGGMGGVTPYHYQWTYTGELRRSGRTRLGEEASDLVGVIPGNDPALAGEYVFVTAHYDHLGTSWGSMYPGADDNASGTAALLETMRLLRYAHPRRSIALLSVSGEEEGLLGSKAFLERPPLALDAIKAEVNMDMVGRGRPGEVHVMPARQDGYVTTLTASARTVATKLGVTLAAGIEQHWHDSDHYSFAERGIPCVCFCTGLHPDYHQPSDTPDKINYGKLATVVKVVRDLVLKTANDDQPPREVPREVWSAWVWAPFQSELAPEVLASAH